MELHLALKNIVNLCGTDILKEQRLVNILADFNAYDDLPSAKFIIKTIIDDGYMRKFLGVGKWDMNCDKLINQFINMTGFAKDKVAYVFECIGFVLQWNHTPPQKPIDIGYTKTGNKLPIPIEDRLRHVVEVINSEEGNCKLILKNPTASLGGKGKIVVSSEVHGSFEWGTFDVLCSVYANNVVVQTRKLAHIWHHEFTGFTIATAEFKTKCEIENITRIIVYIGNSDI